MQLDLVAAHRHVNGNRNELARSEVCGCCFCLRIFSPQEIREWVDGLGREDGLGITALCPYCGIDAVIGSASGLPLGKDFLVAMHDHWF